MEENLWVDEALAGLLLRFVFLRRAKANTVRTSVDSTTIGTNAVTSTLPHLEFPRRKQMIYSKVLEGILCIPSCCSRKNRHSNQMLWPHSFTLYQGSQLYMFGECQMRTIQNATFYEPLSCELTET